MLLRLLQRIAEAPTREHIIGELTLNIDGARESKQYTASNGALSMMGKLTGHLVDRPQPVAPINVTHVTVIVLDHGPGVRIVEGTGEVLEGAGKVVDYEDSPDCAPN